MSNKTIEFLAGVTALFIFYWVMSGQSLEQILRLQ